MYGDINLKYGNNKDEECFEEKVTNITALKKLIELVELQCVTDIIVKYEKREPVEDSFTNSL